MDFFNTIKKCVMKALHFYGFFADVINILKESKKQWLFES